MHSWVHGDSEYKLFAGENHEGGEFIGNKMQSLTHAPTHSALYISTYLDVDY